MYGAGAILGALTTALIAVVLSGLASPLPSVWAAALVAAFAVAAILRDMGVVSFWLPQNARQVPQEVFAFGRSRGALQFGYEMGTGVRTYVTSAAPFVVLVGVILLADGGLVAVVAGVGFGLGRAVMPFARYLSEHRHSWDAQLKSQLRWIVPASTFICSIGVLAAGG